MKAAQIINAGCSLNLISAITATRPISKDWTIPIELKELADIFHVKPSIMTAMTG
jgi:hypothetical protein